MFRRFMIVCWVLFAIAVSGFALNWSQYESLASMVSSVSQDIDNHPAMRLLPHDQNYADTVNADDKTVSDLLRLQSIYADKRDARSELAGLFGLVGLLILLWNIVWHIGHWVWMGRKNND